MPHFSSIPEDVLVLIFAETLDAEKNAFFGRHPCPLPIRLSQLSSRLRQIVLNTPLLWTTFDSQVLQSEAMLDWFLERSQNCGLEIDIRDDHDGLVGKVLRNFDRVGVCVNRWQSLHIRTMEWGLRTIAARFYDLCAPNLKVISIRCFYHGFADESLSTTIFTGGTPSLKSLHLSGAACFPNSLDTLTSLRLHKLPKRLLYTEFRGYLTAMRSLVHLTCIGPIAYWPSTQAAVKAVNLPSLKSLTIDATGMPTPQCVCALCATLPTTTLEHISLKDLTYQMLLSFLSCIRDGILLFPRVKSLTWSTELSCIHDIDTVMTSFAGVEDLTIMGQACDSLLEVLFVYDSDFSMKRHFWPHLHTLNLESRWTTIVPLLHDFVTRRIATDSPIRKVRMVGYPLQDIGNLEEVNWLREHAGLEFVLSINDSY